MKIKNTKKLIERADEHAKLDRIAQMTYGSGTVNGAAEYKGCAVACLGMPSEEKALTDWFRALVEGIQGQESTSPYRAVYYDRDADVKIYQRPSSDEWHFEFTREGQIERMERDFGICPLLASVAEVVFEAQETHGAAIEFIPRFARALAKAEGRDIDNADVLEAWETIGRSRGASRIAGTSADWNSLCEVSESDFADIETEIIDWVETGKLPARA